jgi:hypothetical protein
LENQQTAPAGAPFQKARRAAGAIKMVKKRTPSQNGTPNW